MRIERQIIRASLKKQYGVRGLHQVWPRFKGFLQGRRNAFRRKKGII